MSRFRPPPGPASSGDLKEAVLKLSRDIGSLQKSIDRLIGKFREVRGKDPQREGSRVRAAPDALFAAVDAYVEEQARQKKPLLDAPDLTTLRNVILGLKWNLEGVELDVGAIKAHLEAIESDAHLREDLKKWLVPRQK